MDKKLSYRQIHLDFHTSPLIPRIGESFNAEEFISTLKLGRVDSVNVFAKGHHGMCYFPTKIGRSHPHLKFDLLGNIIEACHAEGISVPIYICTGWEEVAAENEQWLEVSMKGVLGGKTPFEDGHYRWKKLCHNKEGYIEHIIALTDEIIDQYEVDGFWYDIVFQEDCVCKDCQKSMLKAGLDPTNPEDVKKNGFLVIERFMDRIRTHVSSRLPDASVFFNMPIHTDNAINEEYAVRLKNRHQTHIEIESLPSGEWGYNHFPLSVNYLNTIGKQVIGMTGKFHKSWGDFGTLKNPEALAFECFRMTANGCRCSIGDQMHPSGRLDPIVYKRIGEVYKTVESIEPFLIDAKKQRDVAVLMAHNPLTADYTVDEGVMRMMLELQVSFDFIDINHQLNTYRLLVLPDTVEIPPRFGIKIKQFIADGGKVIATATAGIGNNGSEIIYDLFGIKSAKPLAYTPSYIQFDEGSPLGTPDYHYAMYSTGMKVSTLPHARKSGKIFGSYFNRTYNTFCSHCQTPVNKECELDAPLLVTTDSGTYCAYPIFSDYSIHGLRLCRDIFSYMLNEQYSDRLITSDFPTTAEITLFKQEEENRQILHILHYIPQSKSRETEIIDTMIPLYDRTISIRCQTEPSVVRSVIRDKHLGFTYNAKNNTVRISVDKVEGYEVIAIEQ